MWAGVSEIRRRSILKLNDCMKNHHGISMVILYVESFFNFSFDAVPLEDENSREKDEADGDADDGWVFHCNPFKKEKQDRNETEKSRHEGVSYIVSVSQLHDYCNGVHEKQCGNTQKGNHIIQGPSTPSGIPVPEDRQEGNDSHLPDDFLGNMESFLDQKDHIQPDAEQSQKKQEGPVQFCGEDEVDGETENNHDDGDKQ